MEHNIEFNDLLFQALDHAIDSISSGEALIPFVLTGSGINRFVADTFEKGKEEAEKFIKTNINNPLIALAYEGYLTVEGNKMNAIFVKGINQVDGQQVILAQRYQPSTGGENFRVIGNPVLVSKENL